MAQLVVLIAGLLLIEGTQASGDEVDTSTPRGFLSKFMSSGAAFAPRGNQRLITAPSVGASPYTIVNDKPVLHQTAQVQDSMPFTSARAESLISTKDFDPPNIADKEENQVLQKLLTNDSYTPLTLSTIGVGLLSLMTMLGVHMRRRLQPATALASSVGLAPIIPINTATALGDNIMEMKSQGSSVNSGAEAIETVPSCKVDSSRHGWGQLSSQNSRPLTVCYATPTKQRSPSRSSSPPPDRAEAPGSDGKTELKNGGTAHKQKKEMMDRHGHKRDIYQQALMEEWATAWDKEADREGFDWEMEKLRRKFDDIPEIFGGPKYWQQFIEVEPESIYGAYAESTYPGSKPGFQDSFRILFNNLLQFLLDNESEDGAEVASWDWKGALERAGPKTFFGSAAAGDLQTLVGGPLFLLLTKYHRELGPVFKLAFGPRSFIVVADPSIVRYILRDGSKNFDKGILAEILAPILGNGLIPADPDVWRKRRRVISPAFHKKWLQSTLTLFDECTEDLLVDLRKRARAASPEAIAELPDTVESWRAWKYEDDAPARAAGAVDMEERFCSAALDIIGRAVFDYDFESATSESPLVRAVYRCLVEAEKRTTAFIPYWLIPGAQLLPSQKEFNDDLNLLNGKLDELVAKAFADIADLDDSAFLDAGQEVSENDEAGHTSLLRFLVTVRGEEASATQLRDDLMTMLVAGHETTAALLTWTLYELFHPSGRSAHHLVRARKEADAVFAKRAAEGRTKSEYNDVIDVPFVRLCLAEGLRLYPQPPLLIRRALDSDELPRPFPDSPNVTPARGSDIFMSTWSLHKDPKLWDEPEAFDPTRWERKKEPGPDAPAGWRGYDPAKIPAQALFPTEQSADYAYLPFGAGNRRCVGDQFAILEASVMLTSIIHHLDFEFALQDPASIQPKTGLGGLPVADVGMRTGATIHTEHGLWMRVLERSTGGD
jgi:cytochrome P450